jgi:hypothetical protein
MSPGVRKLSLTTHVVCSVGWLGAVAAFLALAVRGLTTSDPQTVRTAYEAARMITWAVIVPLSVAALATGLIQALGTAWGLARHYWVLAKLALILAATVLLLLHTHPVDLIADAALAAPPLGGGLRPLRIQLVFDAGAALATLLVTTALSVFKPRGLTAHGRRVLGEPFESAPDDSPWGRYVLLGVAALVAVFILKHVAGGGMQHQ